MTAGVAKSAGPALTLIEFLDDLEVHLHDRDQHHLRDALAGLYNEALSAAVPARQVHLALIVGIDEANEIAENDAVFVTETGAGQQHRSQAGVLDMDRKPSRDEFCHARFDRKWIIYTGTHIYACRPFGGMLGKGKAGAYFLIEDF